MSDVVRKSSPAAIVLSVAIAALGLPAVAQEAATAVDQASPRLVAVDSLEAKIEPLTLETRANEFRALARDVAALESELGIFKRVAKLVAPSVVHIEARPINEHRVRGGQEAGSGVIVHFRGKPYVLTNRHVIKHSSPSHIRVQLVDGRPFRPEQLWSDSETDVADGVATVETNFLVVQTNKTGESRLFCAGCYEDRIRVRGDTAKFAERIAVLDTFSVPTLLATPV